MQQAEDLCKEALDIDPDCDVAVATLAQLSLQQGKISEAIDWFEKSAKLARTEVELTTAITCEPSSPTRNVIVTQLTFSPCTVQTNMRPERNSPSCRLVSLSSPRLSSPAHASLSLQNYPQMAERLGQLASQLS